MKFNLLFSIFFSLLYFSIVQPYVLGAIGIDPSWTESLVMSIQNKAIFGKDFIFNYGPLGFLNTSLLPYSISPWALFVFHLFILFNFLALINFGFQNFADKKYSIALISVIILVPWGFIADASFSLFYFLLFWILYINETKTRVGILPALIAVILIFYIKLNLSLIAIIVFFASLLYLSLVKKISKNTALISSIILILSVFALSNVLRADLALYIESGLKIIDAYQDAMAVHTVSKPQLYIALFFAFSILGIVLFHILKYKQFFKPNILLYSLLAGAWFLNFKQTFAATSLLGFFGFFLLMPPLIALVYYFEKFTKNRGKLVIIILLMQLTVTQYLRLQLANNSFKGYISDFFPFSIKNEIAQNPVNVFKIIQLKNPINYFQKISNYSYDENFKQEEINKQIALPERILSKVKNEPFDVVPWEVSYAFFNRLNYRPRPVIQSYQANSDWLSAKNEDFYTSEKAPKFVLANLEDFRSQNPIWIDGGVYLALKRNYSIVDSVWSLGKTRFLFEKTGNQPGEKKAILRETKGQLGETIAIEKTDELLYLKATIKYNLLGKFIRFLFQPPYLWCTLTYEDGTQKAFRIPPPILKGGVLINKKIDTEMDFYKFNNNENLNSIIGVTFYSTFSRGFTNEFDYTIEAKK